MRNDGKLACDAYLREEDLELDVLGKGGVVGFGRARELIVSVLCTAEVIITQVIMTYLS